jgi:uncharacterized membrane protein
VPRRQCPWAVGAERRCEGLTPLSELFFWSLGAAIVLRGIGAGMITGIQLISLPTRRRVDIIQFAGITRIQYRGAGVRAYAGITILGALLALALLVAARWESPNEAQARAVAGSLVATILAFVRTGGAVRAMRDLWASADDDVARITRLLNRFTGWGWFSALWHVTAFVALVAALMLSR